MLRFACIPFGFYSLLIESNCNKETNIFSTSKYRFIAASIGLSYLPLIMFCVSKAIYKLNIIAATAEIITCSNGLPKNILITLR